MLRQLSRRGCVDAMIKDGLPGDDTLSNGLAEILQEKEKPADYAHSPQTLLSFPPGLNFPCRCIAVIVPLAVKNCMRGTAQSSSTIHTHENMTQDLSR